ncbi:hypothetical protein [Myceligenerans salitolerans]|uniref:DUF1059 domain-containing protein n=1 Tax=Myceligenerans salitolerans TaxID=1230528 RepID=A0ABS3I8K5_9MICO|nr:hypothetical protein [Myceligenerans salitolerans]MBO0609356.1 hypothetical protein [Myceligenerans salitolerans]
MTVTSTVRAECDVCGGWMTTALVPFGRSFVEHFRAEHANCQNDNEAGER